MLLCMQKFSYIWYHFPGIINMAYFRKILSLLDICQLHPCNSFLKASEMTSSSILLLVSTALGLSFNKASRIIICIHGRPYFPACSLLLVKNMCLLLFQLYYSYDYFSTVCCCVPSFLFISKIMSNNFTKQQEKIIRKMRFKKPSTLFSFSAYQTTFSLPRQSNRFFAGDTVIKTHG